MYSSLDYTEQPPLLLVSLKVLPSIGKTANVRKKMNVNNPIDFYNERTNKS